MPRTPDATPAAVVVTRFTGSGGLTAVMTTASSTPTPSTTASVDSDTTATIHAPSAVPGIRPIVIQVTPGRSTAWCSRATMTSVIGNTTSVRVAGSVSGLRSARTGTATRLLPNPSEPWTSAPIPTADGRDRELGGREVERVDQAVDFHAARSIR